MKRILLLAVLVLVVASMTFATGETEPEYPRKPITIVCPWSAGGGTDRTARFVAEQLSEVLGQPVNVVNETGGAGAVGHSAAANAAPDGYTIGNLTFEVNTLSYLGYSDVTPNDFIPLLQFNQDPAAVTVGADSPYETVPELLDAVAASAEGTFSFSGSGIGTVWDLSRIAMLDLYGIDPTSVKYIPSQGAAPATTELLGGHVDVITCSYPEVAPQVEAGALKTLAIMADDRNPNFDHIPTLKEQGIDYAYGTWRGFAVPLGTPDDVVEILRDALVEVVEGQAFLDFMETSGFGIQIRVGDEFGAFMQEQFVSLEDIFELAGYNQQ
ncbi:MAG: tripartite tricarboxylate transporter substrate binding protein [Spirochaetales bacterium]|nr:tripartite tricarboxylate transporter substrate binding protein [Spirochaetales bacterium]